MLGFRTIVLAACALGSACASDSNPSDDVRAMGAPIVDGQTDPGHPATVALALGGSPFCSGTLVSPTVVVTAAHCIFPGIGVDPPTQIDVLFGTDASAPTGSVHVVEGKYDALFDINNPDENDDIAVLRLASAAPVAPIAMAKLPSAGATVTLVGFGITVANGNDAGTKRFATAAIFQAQPKTFSMTIAPSGTCNGDSGGSALHDDGTSEKLIGVHTRSDCSSFMLDERVDVHLADFIQPFIDVDATCGPDFGCAKGCSSPDPDCPCAKDGFCTTACPDLATDPDCDPHCVADGVCALDCPIADPDCPVCVADGVCVAACSDDPDCRTTSSSSGSGGAPASAGGAGPGEQPTKDVAGGCDCSLEGAPVDASSSLWAWIATIALVASARRRLGLRWTRITRHRRSATRKPSCLPTFRFLSRTSSTTCK